MSISTIKDQDGKQYIIFDESELYDDKEMGDKLEDFEIQQILGKGSYGFANRFIKSWFCKRSRIMQKGSFTLTKIESS